MSARPKYKKHRCKHFNGIQHDKCRAGINYVELAGEPRFGMALRLPCLRENGDDVRICDHYEEPTDEEVAEHEAWVQKRIDQLRVVMTTIRPWRKKHEGESFAEIIECPICQGRLHLTIAAYNGHVHGKCETEECVSWME